MRGNSWITVLVLSWLLAAVQGCASGADGGAGRVAPPASGTGPSAVLAQLDALPAPEGAEAQTFAMLKSRLRTMLAAPGVKLAAAAPASSRSKVVDLYMADTSGSAWYSWTYRNEGDYNLNGAVEITDITPLGVHFGKTQASTDWFAARTADGNGDGVINLADLVSIGVNFGRRVTRYVMEYSSEIGSGENWAAFVEVPLSLGVQADGRLTYSVHMAFCGAGFYRAVPYDELSAGVPGMPTPCGGDCRGNWYMFGRDQRHTHHSPAFGPSELRLKWKYAARSAITGSPALNAAGMIYIACMDGTVHAITPDGQCSWTSKLDGATWSSPAVSSSGCVLLSCQDQFIYALDPHGGLSWRLNTFASTSSSPLVTGNGHIYYCSDYLTCLSENSSFEWKYQVHSDFCAPVIDAEGVVYALGEDAGIYAVQPGGVEKWAYLTSGAFDTSPALGSDNTVYAGCSDGKLYAINESGGLEWAFDTGAAIRLASPALASDGCILIGNAAGALYAINPDGTERWHYSTSDGISVSPALDASGYIYFGNDDGIVFCVDMQGKLVWNYATGAEIGASPALADDGTVYIGNDDGVLYAFGPGDME